MTHDQGESITKSRRKIIRQNSKVYRATQVGLNFFLKELKKSRTLVINSNMFNKLC